MQKCIVSFTTDNGREVHVGDMLSNDDPVIAGREDRFEPFEEEDAENLSVNQENRRSMPHVEPVEAEVAKDQAVGPERAEKRDDDDTVEPNRRVTTQQPDVEQATAEPGEKRNTRRS